MKRIFTKIPVLCLVIAVPFFTGCLSDDLMGAGGSTTTETTETATPDNSVIDARVFEALDLSKPGLSAVKSYYESDQYYLAAQALLDKATSPEVQAIVGSNETNESKLARLRALLFGQRKTVTPEFVDAPSS